MTSEKEPIRRTAIVATTHPVRGVIVARSALEQMVEQIDEQGLPSYFEHDPTQPPIGRAYAARLQELDDGEWAVVVDFEFYNAGYRALIVQGELPLASTLPEVPPGQGRIEIALDDLNWEPEDIAVLDQQVRDLGIDLAPSLERRAAVPDPILIFGLVNVSVAFGWFAKGFFTKAGERLGEAVGDDVVAGYERLKDAVRRAVARRKPADRPPIILFHITLDDDGRDVLVEGSSRDSDPDDVGRFLDAGKSLVDLAQRLLPVLPNRREVTKLHFRYEVGRDGWILEYGLAAGSEAFVFLQAGPTVTPDEPSEPGQLPPAE